MFHYDRICDVPTVTALKNKKAQKQKQEKSRISIRC